MIYHPTFLVFLACMPVSIYGLVYFFLCEGIEDNIEREKAKAFFFVLAAFLGIIALCAIMQYCGYERAIKENTKIEKKVRDGK